MIRLFFTFSIVTLMSFCASAAGVKKWVDAEGKTHYGERPPEEVRAKSVNTKVSTVSGGGQVQADKVILYSTSWCGYCKRARKYMAAKGIAYSEYDIEKDAIAKSRYQRAGGVGVPFLVRGDDIQRGFSRASYDRFFRE